MRVVDEVSVKNVSEGQSRNLRDNGRPGSVSTVEAIRGGYLAREVNPQVE